MNSDFFSAKQKFHTVRKKFAMLPCWVSGPPKFIQIGPHRELKNCWSWALPLKSALRARGMQKHIHGTYDEILPALATYLPTSPSTAKSRTQRRRGGRGGSPIPRPVLFLLRTCADVRFSVQIPPKPAGDLENFRARARERPPRAARTAATPPKPQVPQNGCFWLQMASKQGGDKNPGNIFAGAGLPTYLPCAPCTFFCMPLGFIFFLFLFFCVFLCFWGCFFLFFAR